MTASAPAASALRSTAPRFPGFSTLSSTTTSGSGRSRSSSSVRSRARTSAIMPSVPPLYAILPYSSGVTSMIRTPEGVWYAGCRESDPFGGMQPACHTPSGLTLAPVVKLRFSFGPGMPGAAVARSEVAVGCREHSPKGVKFPAPCKPQPAPTLERPLKPESRP